MTLNNETIKAAQVLASFDWPVFPVNPDTKALLLRGWQSRATCDRSGIIDLLTDYPSAAIRLVNGQKSGLIVIHIDERENFSDLSLEVTFIQPHLQAGLLAGDSTVRLTNFKIKNLTIGKREHDGRGLYLTLFSPGRGKWDFPVAHN